MRMTSICLRPLEEIELCPTVIDSLLKPRGENIKHSEANGRCERMLLMPAVPKKGNQATKLIPTLKGGILHYLKHATTLTRVV